MLGQPIPEVRLKLYHATYSKNNFATLISFLNECVRPDIASGYGQGHGFYVWTTIKRAVQHVTFQKESHTDYSGYPILIVLNEKVNPKDWDLDYEVNAGLIIAFIWGHWKLFKSIPDDVIFHREQYLVVSKCEKHPFFKNIAFKFSGGRINGSATIKNSDPCTEDAALLSMIFNYLQEHYHSITQKFEISVFLKLAKKGIALKYVGNKPLHLENFMIEVDGKWLEGEEARSIARLNGVKF